VLLIVRGFSVAATSCSPGEPEKDRLVSTTDMSSREFIVRSDDVQSESLAVPSVA